MPIYKLKEKLLYFAHIPKCGGTSVEQYLNNICQKEAFKHDYAIKKSFVWTKSSPQHVDGENFARLFPDPSFFYLNFAVVRNPYNRVLSAFNFKKYVTREIRYCNIEQFIKGWLRKNANVVGSYDNHFLPMTRFLHPKANVRIFKLEDGLDHIPTWLGRELGINLSPPIIPRVNVTADMTWSNGKKSIRPYKFRSTVRELVRRRYYHPDRDMVLSDDSKDIISRIYSDDFSRFEYKK